MYRDPYTWGLELAGRIPYAGPDELRQIANHITATLESQTQLYKRMNALYSTEAETSSSRHISLQVERMKTSRPHQDLETLSTRLNDVQNRSQVLAQHNKNMALVNKQNCLKLKESSQLQKLSEEKEKKIQDLTSKIDNLEAQLVSAHYSINDCDKEISGQNEELRKRKTRIDKLEYELIARSGQCQSPGKEVNIAR